MIPELHLHGRVTYPRSATQGLIGTALNVSVSEACGRHTIFQVTHKGKAKYAQESLRSGAPMVVDISAHKGTRRWFGYVDSVTEKDSEEFGKTTDIVGVGVTYFMKDASDYVLGTLLAAERGLIKRAGLVPIVRGPDSDKPVLSDGRSQWQVLTQSADEYGQYVFTIGTTVHVMRIADIFAMYKMEAPRLVCRGTNTVDPWSLSSFRAPVTDNVIDRQIAYGSDPLTAAVTRVESGNSMFRTYPGYVARNVQEQMSSESVLQTATASGNGHVEVVAGKPVYIDGATPGPWWLVNSVQHSFDTQKNEYTMDLSLHRTRSVMDVQEKFTAPRKNLNRVGDNGERVNLEQEPKFEYKPMILKGAMSWASQPRWRAQC
jgi:hypothetical protein